MCGHTHVWDKLEIPTKFWSENQMGRSHMRYVDGVKGYIKMVNREIECGGVNWIQLAQ
jgi:hypothetical protein